jgi:hypothetical protein
MNTKLTLKLNKKTIERAKRYARKNKKSLSIIVENYFDLLSDNETPAELHISPNVLELSGIVSLHENTDIKEIYGKHIEEKYSK